MTPDETVILARYVRALCPQQAMDEYTPDAWHDVLQDVTLSDARSGAARVARRQPFVAPAEILAEVHQLHAERLDGFQYEPVPGDDDPQAYLTAYRQQRAAVTAGTRPAAPAAQQLPPARSDMKQMLTAAGRHLPDDEAPRTPRPTSIACPTCTARIGQPCKTPSGKHRSPHGARRRALTAGAAA
ncbi:zinc finger domain-containing protein [Streptomyces sulphureus]|uniref:zinc finger domain-containing protein n=1 Tax=Streptomyces sulphureus TaxID=47758 RepID=UPI00037FE0C6|nr:hypothetical protein [Streptomyces sulphureus]